MNKQRRKELNEVKEKLAVLKDCLDEIELAEREYRDGIPEGIRCGKKGEDAEESVDALEEAHGFLALAMEAIAKAAREV